MFKCENLMCKGEEMQELVEALYGLGEGVKYFITAISFITSAISIIEVYKKRWVFVSALAISLVMIAGSLWLLRYVRVPDVVGDIYSVAINKLGEQNLSYTYSSNEKM